MTQLNGRMWKLVWGGGLFLEEEWSCSVSMVAPVGGEVVAKAANFALPLTDWMNRAGSRLNPASRLEFVKFNEVRRVAGAALTEKQGTYVSPNSDTHEVVPAVTGKGVADGPGQICLAITLRTERGRGRASKGRFYSPVASGDFIDADGGLQSPIPLNAAISAQQLMSELNAVARVGVSAGTSPLVAVYSRIGNIAFDAQQVSVGRVLDTQRRRRASIPESPVLATAAI